MNSGEGKPETADKELIRQREIDIQLADLRSPAPHIRAAAARRLGDLRAGVDELLDCLHDPLESVRAAAAMALGNFAGDTHYDEIVDTLMAAIDDASEKVCQAAIRSLGLLRAEAAREEIAEFLGDPNPYILGAAVVALARLSNDDAAPRLAEFLDHPNSFVRTQAVRAVALRKYAPASPKITALLEKAHADRLAEALAVPTAQADRGQAEQYSILSQLIQAAGELKIHEAAPLLMEIAQKEVGFRGLSVEALISIGGQIDPGLLTSLLSDPSVNLRKRLIRLICQYQYLPALPMVRSLLQDNNVAMRETSLQAVAQFNDMEALPRIVWMCYHDSNPFLRIQALEVLFQLLGCAAEPDLAALAQDVNFQVRRAAARYLLECKPHSKETVNALYRFCAEFPEDPLAQEIQVAVPADKTSLDSRGTPAKYDEVLVPESLRNSIPYLYDTLTAWHEAITQNIGPKSRALSASLAYILVALREKENPAGESKQ